MIKIIFKTFFIFIAAVGEVSLIWSLPYPLNLATIVVPMLVFLIITKSNRSAWIFIFVAGLVLDIFNFNPVGIHILFLAALYLFARYLFYNFFTNKTLPSVILLAVSLIIPYEIFNHMLNSLEGPFLQRFFNVQDIQIIGLSIIINLIFIITVYLVLRILFGIVNVKIFSYERI